VAFDGRPPPTTAPVDRHVRTMRAHPRTLPQPVESSLWPVRARLPRSHPSNVAEDPWHACAGRAPLPGERYSLNITSPRRDVHDPILPVLSGVVRETVPVPRTARTGDTSSAPRCSSRRSWPSRTPTSQPRGSTTRSVSYYSSGEPGASSPSGSSSSSDTPRGCPWWSPSASTTSSRGQVWIAVPLTLLVAPLLFGAVLSE
jgi:hypothetical protein